MTNITRVKTYVLYLLGAVIVIYGVYAVIPRVESEDEGKALYRELVFVKVGADRLEEICQCEVEVLTSLDVNVRTPYAARDQWELQTLADAGACGIVVTKVSGERRYGRYYVSGVAFKASDCDKIRRWQSVFS